MKKSAKFWLVIAIVLIVFGSVISGFALGLEGWDFTKLGTKKYQTNTYEGFEEFNDIFIEVDTADVVILPSEEEMCKVVCHEEEKILHTVAVENNTLIIRKVDMREWYDYVGISWGTMKVSVYLPKAEYGALFIRESTGDVEIAQAFTFESIDISISTGDVRNYASALDYIKIKTSTGDVDVVNVDAKSVQLNTNTGRVKAFGIACAGELNVNVSTGKTVLEEVTCQSFDSVGGTGDVSLKKVWTTEKLSIERSAGDIYFESCDAEEIFVKTSTGDVKGTLCSEKEFITNTGTGSVQVPSSTSGGRCTITTSTGDIKIQIENM